MKPLIIKKDCIAPFFKKHTLESDDLSRFTHPPRKVYVKRNTLNPYSSVVLEKVIEIEYAEILHRYTYLLYPYDDMADAMVIQDFEVEVLTKKIHHHE